MYVINDIMLHFLQLVISGENKKMVLMSLDEESTDFDDVIDAVVDTIATALPVSVQ